MELVYRGKVREVYADGADLSGLRLASLANLDAVVVDARVTKEESVFPMIAPGQAARNMVG